MSDKKKSELSVVPEFVDGEQPTAAKLNSIGSLLKREGFILEKSVGDIWGESEPYSDVSQNLLSSPIIKEGLIDNLDESQDGNGRSLDIVNLGRAIGPMSKLNPKVLTQGLSNGRTTEVKEEIPAGVYEYKMKMPVDWSETISFPPADDAYEIRVFSLGDLNSEGDYYVDEEKNTVYSYMATGNSAYPYVTYKTTPSKWASGSSYSMSNFNTIPDISQIGYSDLSISQNAQGLYEFVFPEVTHTSRTNGDSSLIEGNSPLFGSTYTLPASIRAVCGGNYFAENSGITNTVIPEGMIYLKNAVTGEIYSDATYYYNSDSSVLVEGVELDLDDNYYFITVGTDLTSCIEDIYNKLGNHSHDGKYGEKSISVKDISDNYLNFDNDQKVYFPSTKEGNHFSQYLHRDGYISGDPHNDGNAMRGDLVIGRKASSAGNYLGDGDTYKISFGKRENSSSLWREETLSGTHRLNIGNSVSNESLYLNTGAGDIANECAQGEFSTIAQLNSLIASQGTVITGGIEKQSHFSGCDSDTTGSTSEMNWFHAKTAEISYYMSDEWVWGSKSRWSLDRATNPSNVKFLRKAISLPSWLASSNGNYLYDVTILFSPGTSTLMFAGYDGNQQVPSSYWFGSSAMLNEDGGNGACWYYKDSSSEPYLIVLIPVGGPESVVRDGTLSFQSDEGGENLYAGLHLDVRITVKYRIG